MRTILFTSIGRRVQLVRHFIEHGWNVIGADIHPEECAAKAVLGNIRQVPRYNDPSYLQTLLTVCLEEQVDCLIPLFEPELVQLAKAKDEFRSHGIKVIVSDDDVLERCLNKYELFQYLRQRQVLTPDTFIDPDLIDNSSMWVVKPTRGMGSKDVHIVTATDVAKVFPKLHRPVVQRFIEGREYSIDAYVAEDGNVLSVVPRLRLEVRSGEVSKSVTVEDQELIDLTVSLLKMLKLFGPVTIQGIREESTGNFYYIEVNPRFGGGVPLSIQAGIPYAAFIKGEYDPSMPGVHPYRRGLKMLRYDEAVFVNDEGKVMD